MRQQLHSKRLIPHIKEKSEIQKLEIEKKKNAKIDEENSFDWNLPVSNIYCRQPISPMPPIQPVFQLKQLFVH